MKRSKRVATVQARLGGVLAVGTVSALVLTGCGGGVGADGGSGTLEDMDPITLSVPDIDAEGAGYNLGLVAFAEEVEERTGGKITFEIYPSASLMPGNEMLSGIGSGAADMGRLISSYFPQELPVANWYDSFSGLNEDPAYPQGYIASSIAAHVANVSDGPLRTELESHNVTPLSSWKSTPYADMMCTQPVDGPDDLEGRQIRASGDIIMNEVESLGAVPVPMPLSEVYEGLQRGVIDCAVLEPPSHIAFGVWEVAPYYVPVQLTMRLSAPLVINTDVWNSLPAEAQQIMQESAAALLENAHDGMLALYQRFADEGPAEHNTEFVDARGMDEILAQHRRDRFDEAIANAPAGIDDPQVFADEIAALNEEWFENISEVLPVDESLNARDPETLREVYVIGADLDLDPVWTMMREKVFAE